MTIGQLAKAARVNVETIRFYERERLLPQPPRRASGYREYSGEALQRVHFIRRTQELGFSLREVSEFLRLRVDPRTTCGNVKEKAEQKLHDIDAKLRDLKRMKTALLKLSSACRGRGPTSQCPILEALQSTPSRKGNHDSD